MQTEIGYNAEITEYKIFDFLCYCKLLGEEYFRNLAVLFSTVQFNLIPASVHIQERIQGCVPYHITY